MMMMEVMMTTETLIFLYVILCQHKILFTRVKSDQQKQMKDDIKSQGCPYSRNLFRIGSSKSKHHARNPFD